MTIEHDKATPRATPEESAESAAAASTRRTAIGAMGAVGAVAALGLGLTAYRRVRGRQPARAPKRGEAPRPVFADYLRDHLTGSETAVSVVERLKQSHRGSREGLLCERLSREFGQERDVVRAMLTDMGETALSLKRVVGRAAGAVLQGPADGEPGDLALFRALEGLAVAVQGKRCLWRAAQRMTPLLQAPGSQSFRALEEQAVDQWEQIERCREALVRRTFA